MTGGIETELAALPEWLTWGTAVCLVLVLVAWRDIIRSGLFQLVDPRPLALFRIGFTLVLLVTCLEVAPLNIYLFSDEGFVPSSAVPQLFGRHALPGYGDGIHEPTGFVDLQGVLHFLSSGRYSLLYFWDSPAFVHGYFAVLLTAAIGLLLGIRTRICAGIVWFLYVGMLRRNDVHWGGEQVYCSLLFLLMLSRCGTAYSLDNWLRCRKLRGHGLLDRPERGGGAGMAPGPQHPHGLMAIYRRIPCWPQVLIVIQVALCYTANGWLKSGGSWRSGEAMYLALHLDRYTRLDWHALSLALPQWLLQIATWSVLWWERLFPLLLLGLWLRWRNDQKPVESSPRLRAIGLVGIWGLVVAGLFAATRPAIFGDVADSERWMRAMACGMAALGIALVAAFPKLWQPGSKARTLVTVAFGPRLWLGFGCVFHGLNLLLLNVGTFQLALLAAYTLCGAGMPLVATLGCTARRFNRRGVPLPEGITAESSVLCEDIDLPHLQRENHRLPAWALACAAASILMGLYTATRSEASHPQWWWHGTWLSVGAGLLVVSWLRDRRVLHPTGVVAAAYGPVGRLAVGGVFAYHLTAILLYQTPAWSCFPRRDAVRRVVDPWLELTFTRQRWGMFSPNPPKTNRSLRTIVVDAQGRRHDFATELQRPENFVRPYLWHDRERKLHEVMMTYRRWIARWHARYQCRRWALDHEGTPPKKVILQVIEAPFAGPDTSDPVAFFWRQARAVATLEVPCIGEPFAALDPEVRGRYGYAPQPRENFEIDKARAKSWAKRKARLDPLQPLWPALGLILTMGLFAWRRRRV